MPSTHALLSPSAAHRWLNCTAAPRLEAAEPDEGSDFAREGTLAHAYCAMKLKATLGLDTDEERREIEELNEKYHTQEMDEHTDTYHSMVIERLTAARKVTEDAQLLVETRIDLTSYIPEAFGTTDATIIADGCMEVIDFKYGKGVRVSAVRNEQMMIYALGAYLRHSFEYSIERIRMTIIQPRLDNISEYETTVSELLQWAAEVLLPKAREAYGRQGRFAPGEWCRFCKVRSKCRALSENCKAVAQQTGDPKLLSTADIARDVLPWLPVIKQWVAGMEEYALQTALSGTEYPGYKLVEGRSIRRVTDEAAVGRLLSEAGYREADYMTPAKLCGLTALEKLTGKKKFATLCGDYIERPQGKPTLVEARDPRQPYNAAGGDFDNIEV